MARYFKARRIQQVLVSRNPNSDSKQRQLAKVPKDNCEMGGGSSPGQLRAAGSPHFRRQAASKAEGQTASDVMVPNWQHIVMFRIQD